MICYGKNKYYPLLLSKIKSMILYLQRGVLDEGTEISNKVDQYKMLAERFCSLNERHQEVTFR